MSYILVLWVKIWQIFIPMRLELLKTHHCALVGIGLTETPNSGWAKAHPAHPLAPSYHESIGMGTGPHQVLSAILTLFQPVHSDAFSGILVYLE
jgi:hypothetical protein